MNKKFLAVLVAGALMICSLLPVGASTNEEPTYIIDIIQSKVFNDFPTGADTLKASPGVTSEGGMGYYASASTYTLAYDSQTTGLKVTGDGTTVSMSFRIKSTSISGANMVSLWADATEVTGDKNGYVWTRPFFDYGAQKSGGKDLGRYMAGGSTFYFVEDGKTDVTVLNATKPTSVYDVRAPFVAGKKGTYYFPEECFQSTTVAENGYNYTYPSDSWTSFGDAYLSGDTNSWYMNNTNYPYANFSFQQTTISEGEYMIFDDFMWVNGVYKQEGEIIVPETILDDYSYSVVSEDFSDFTLDFSWRRGDGNFSGYANDPGSALSSENFSVADGKFSFTPTDDALDGTRYTVLIDEIGEWRATYDAFSFDLDISGTKTALTLRPKFVGYSVENGEEVSSYFSVNNGTIYFIDDEGIQSEVATTSTDGLYQWAVPSGFKGKVVIPKQTVHFSSGTAGENITDSFDELGLQYEILNWKASDNGATVSLDNLTFYTNVNPNSPIPELDELLGDVSVIYECQDDSVLYTYNDKTLDDFNAVCNHYTQQEYSKYGDHTKNGNRFTTFVKGSTLAHIYWLADSGELNIVVSQTAGAVLPAKTSAPVGGGAVSVIQLENSVNMNSMTYVVKLSDGTFLVYDGGFKHMADDILAVLNEMSETEKPVVRAWLLTHSHNDHYQAFRETAMYYCDDIVLENVILAPIASALSDDTYLNSEVVQNIAKFQGAKTIYAHTGMEFTFSGLNMEILLTPDDLYKVGNHGDDTNNASIVSRLYADNYSFLILGDIGVQGSTWMENNYGDYLKSNMCQVSHHGMETVPASFYDYVQAQILFYPCNEELYVSSRNKSVRDALEQESYTKEILIAGRDQFVREWGTVFDEDAPVSKPETDGKTWTVTVCGKNNAVLTTFTVKDGECIASNQMPEAPERTGYKFVGWSEDITLPVSSDISLYPTYEKDTTVFYSIENTGDAEISVTLPEGQDSAYYDDRIVLSAPAEYEDAAFDHWVVNGSIFSYKRSISFLTFDTLEVEAVYTATPTEDKTVIYTNTNSKYVARESSWDMQVMGVVSAEGNVSEIGILFAASPMTSEEMLTAYNSGSPLVRKMKSDLFMPNRQFVYNITGISMGAVRCATTYAVVDGELRVGDGVSVSTVSAN